jgi:hypothetical protein
VEKYPLVSKSNITAYLKVMSAWAVLSMTMAALLKRMSGGSVSGRARVAFSMSAIMLGMMIMFGASALNLRKLRPGFERLASGAPDPGIPKVWCPVLTMATRSAVELSERMAQQCGTEAL